jgi:hypothetical protein
MTDKWNGSSNNSYNRVKYCLYFLKDGMILLFICWDHRKKEQKCVLKAIKAVILSQITWKRFNE